MVSQIISRLLLLLFCLSMMIASAKANIQEAINYYENRHDQKISNQYIDKAINIFNNELDRNESNQNIALYILKCYYYKGEYILNDIKEYFIFLFKEQKGSVNIQNESIVEQKIVEKVYLSIGNYIFYLSQGREYPARFSFILDISLENPIIHHHSSQIKEN